jgi:hypothetical protein
MNNIKLINKVTLVSKLTLLISFAGFVATLLMSYQYAEYFSLILQVMAHILTIVFAAIFKVAVVVLMAATKELRAANSDSYERARYVTT